MENQVNVFMSGEERDWYFKGRQAAFEEAAQVVDELASRKNTLAIQHTEMEALATAIRKRGRESAE